MFPKKLFFYAAPVMPVWILASLTALRYAVWREKHTRNAFPMVIPEEKISQTPILLMRCSAGSSLVCQSGSSLMWLPAGCQRRLFFSRRAGVAAEYLTEHQSLWEGIYIGALSRAGAFKTTLPLTKMASSRAISSAEYFFPKFFLSKDTDVYLWRSLYYCPEIADICETPGLAMRKQPTFGKAYKENWRHVFFLSWKVITMHSFPNFFYRN